MRTCPRCGCEMDEMQSACPGCLAEPPLARPTGSVSGMRWKPKNAKPPTAGWYYVRPVFSVKNNVKCSIRYYDDSNSSWWMPSANGMNPNDSFSEWLLIPGLEQRR